MAVSEQQRQFTSRETEEILERATRLEQQGALKPTAQGLSLAELEQIARDAGIDPAAIHRAVAELDAERTPGLRARLMGGPSESTAVRVLPHPVDPSRFESVVEQLRRRFNDAGRVEIVGRTLTWISTAAEGAAQTQVVVAPRENGTELRVHLRAGRRDRAVFPAGWGLGMIASLGVVAAIGNDPTSGPTIMGAMAGFGALGLFGGRWAFRVLARRRAASAEEIARQLSALIEG